MKLRYGLTGKEEYTQKEVADMLNISQSYISRIEKKVLINRSSAMQSFKSEINIVGLRVEEATDKLETFLQNALVSGAEEVKIIHGVGTGILIKTVREILKEKKYVKEFRFGKYGEGDRGVTIVTFK